MGRPAHGGGEEAGVDFQGSGRPLSDAGLDRVCGLLGTAEAEVWAVLTVETNGFGFLGDRRPRILFERHKFSALTDRRFDADNPAISSREPGGYAHGAGEYARLEAAMALDREAALKSASWGIGQVMGFNHDVAGYPDVDTMVADMVANEDAQLNAMAKFIAGNGLAGALQRHGWASFARGYNGADYQRNSYDARLAAACAKWQVMLPDLALRTAQVALMYLGLDPGPIDGLRGRRTRAALVAYQQRAALAATGELDQGTGERLFAEAFPAA